MIHLKVTLHLLLVGDGIGAASAGAAIPVTMMRNFH